MANDNDMQNQHGYKKTTLGWIPLEWEIYPAGELFDIQLGKMLNKIAKSGTNQHPYLANYNVRWGKFALKEVQAMNFTEKEKEKYLLRKGDLLVCEGGEVGRAAIWNEEISPCYYQKALHRLRPKVKKIEPQFMMYYLSTAVKSSHIVNFVGESSIAHFTREKFAQFPVPVPPIIEQRQIVENIKHWDRAIDLLGRLIVDKQGRRKWLMQQLLTGNRRLPGFNKPWEQRKLANFFKEFSFLNRDNRDLIPLSCSKVYGIVPQSVIFDKRVASEDIRRYKIVSRGDLIYDPMLLWDASIGFQDEVDEGVISPAYCTFKYKQGGGMKDYFRYLFKSHYMRHQYKVISQGTNTRRRKAPSNAFLEIAIPIPTDAKEQKAIVKVIGTADRELELLCSELDALREQKKGLMQKLLTGKVRVKV